MLKTELRRSPASSPHGHTIGRVVVIWIDWYAYHIARFRGLVENQELAGNVRGIEMVGGMGVHAGLKFREDRRANLPVQTLFPKSSWSEVQGWKMSVALWQRLSSLDPQVVLVPGYYTAPGLAAALWGKLKGRRTVLMTETTEGDHKRVALREAFKTFLLRSLFDWAVAGGTAHRRYLQHLGFRPDRIAGFYDVVDNDFFRDRSAAIRKHSEPADFDLPDRYFLYVGRLAEEKNIGGLIAAYFEYRRAGGEWSLVLVGDGPERKALEELAASSLFGVDIHFAGLRGTAELPQYYAFAGCFVLPSVREPWGLVANEAMAAGLPLILSSRCGCTEDLLEEGVNGCAFDPAYPADLTACLTALSELDPESLSEMGRHSQEIVARFSPAAWASEIARIARSPR